MHLFIQSFSPAPIRLVGFIAACLIALAVVPGASAQTAPHCAPGQAPQFNFGFANLDDLLGPTMGEPVECPHPNPENGDVLQRTTAGLAFWRKATNTPTFTDGWEHWGLTEAGLVYWTGASIDPPPSAQSLAPPAAEPSVTISPTSGQPGTVVQVGVRGFPASAPVEIGVGPWRSEFEVIGRAMTWTEGTLTTQTTIPTFADGQWVVVVQTDEPPATRTRAVSNVFEVTSEASDPALFTHVQVPLIALEQGNIGCNDAIEFVERQVEPTAAPLTVTLEQLLAIDERTVGPRDLYNAFHASDLRVTSATVENGTATIHFVGDYQLGGVCDNPRFEAQLHHAALQFDTVEEVEVFINDRPLHEILSLR